MNRFSVSPLAAAGLLCLSTAAEARQFFYVAEGGVPTGMVFETYPTINPNSSGATSASAYSELAYFTETGLTGTKRDQLEVWAGGTFGYTNPKGAPNSSGWGIATPEIGFEYYFNIIQPTAPVGSSAYRSWWSGPEVWLNFPNGNTQTAGFGAGADQYSVNISDNNSIEIGRWVFAVNPLEINYQFTNLNTTQSSSDPSVFFKQRFGLSLTFGDVAIGYQVSPTLTVGVAQQYNANSIASSTVAPSHEGFIGPTATYSGVHGMLISAAVQTDYYHQNTARNTYIALWFTKHF
jgi:hypothetical protein